MESSLRRPRRFFPAVLSAGQCILHLSRFGWDLVARVTGEHGVSDGHSLSHGVFYIAIVADVRDAFAFFFGEETHCNAILPNLSGRLMVVSVAEGRAFIGWVGSRRRSACVSAR